MMNENIGSIFRSLFQFLDGVECLSSFHCKIFNDMDINHTLNKKSLNGPGNSMVTVLQWKSLVQ